MNEEVTKTTVPKTKHPYISSSEKVALKQTLAVAMLANLLEHYHPKNRHASGIRIEALERDIVAGHWRPDVGQFIRFNRKGEIIDGQKRIMAHRNVNIPMVVNIHYGLPEDAILYMDGDQHRTIADNYSLRIHDVPTAKDFAANRLRFSIAAWCKHGLRWEIAGTPRNKMVWTEAELMQFCNENKELIDFVLPETKTTRRPGILGAMAIYAMKDKTAATAFRNKLFGDGKGLKGNDPIRTLRKYLEEKSVGGSYPIYDFNNTIRAINAFHNGRQLPKHALCNDPADWDLQS